MNASYNSLARLNDAAFRPSTLDDELAAHHAHAARVRELTFALRLQTHRRRLERGESAAYAEVGEDYLLAARRSLVAVELKLRGHALLQDDHVGRVAALDRHLYPLHARVVRARAPLLPLAEEEEPEHKCYECRAERQHNDFSRVHDLNSCRPARDVCPSPRGLLLIRS